MIGKIKCLIYPILYTNIAFTMWYKNNNSLTRNFEFDNNINDYKLYGNIKYISRFSDKESITGKNFDEIYSILNIEKDGDKFIENINGQIYYNNEGKEYYNKYSYLLTKNNEIISFDDLPDDLPIIIKN